jgi:hypothetical protein
VEATPAVLRQLASDLVEKDEVVDAVVDVDDHLDDVQKDFTCPQFAAYLSKLVEAK